MKPILFLLLLTASMPLFAQPINETYVEVSVNGLPALECSVSTQSEPKPLVIALHYYGGSKESLKEIAATLAKAGMFVVMPLAYGHKERLNNDGLTVTEIAVRTANEIDQFLNHYANDSRVKPNRVGLLGVSMGAIATYAYLAQGTGKVAAAVALIGTPDFTLIEGVELARHIRDPKSEGRLATNDEYSRLLRFCKENNPLDRWEKMRGVHLLMQNGTHDPLIRLDGVNELYKRLTSPLQESVEVQLHVYDINHTLTTLMVERSVAFLDRHLSTY